MRLRLDVLPFKLFWGGISEKIKGTSRISSLVFLVCFFLFFLSLAILAGFSVFDQTHRYILILLGLDIIALLLLGGIVAKKIVKIWVDRQQGLAGSQIHVKVTTLFAVVSVIPSISMAVFSIVFFHYGVQDWFSGRIKQSLSESVAVASSYLSEHKRVVAKDVALMAMDVSRELPKLVNNHQGFNQYLTAMASLRSLTEAIVFDESQDLLGRSDLTIALQFEPIPTESLLKARKGEVVLLSSQSHDRMRALIALPGIPGTFLFVGRAIDPTVLKHLKKSQDIFREYGALEGQRTGFELLVMALFCVVSLLLLFVSIWVGMSVADRLIEPVQALMEAVEKLRLGHLNVRVPEKNSTESDEISILSRSFNKMAQTIKEQQGQLIQTNEELDRRRQFIESTLAGVSVGVIGLDEKARIIYPNHKASVLLKTDLTQKIGKKVGIVFPPIRPVLSQAIQLGQDFFEQQILLSVRGLQATFSIRILSEFDKNRMITGYIITLDDITALLEAQKKAAWSDVARRVAHEIKNPLTPIHLAAERLKRKYLKEIASPQVFTECLDTIIRQVGHIDHMVSEFSSFARMPKSVFRVVDLVSVIENTVVLQKQVTSSINFILRVPEKPVEFLCDEQQVAQALLNLIKNSMESILDPAFHHDTQGEIIVSLLKNKNGVKIVVEDNGPGFPHGLEHNVVDPYVTTRPHGSGLGLSIVKRIMEDHQGDLVLEQRQKGQGARVSMIFPIRRNMV